MRKTLAALLLVSATAAAQENPTAYEALRIVGTKLNRDYVKHVVSLTGTNGNPQPETWKILLEDPTAQGGVREVEVTNGRITSERTPVRTIVGSAEGATIQTARLNLDSSGAFTVASHTAEKSNTRFATVSYTLRTDEHGDPIWIVTLHGESGRPVGTIHINCNRGNVVRTEGMFAGASMSDVETAHDVEQHTRHVERHHNDSDNNSDDDDDDKGILSGPRERLTKMFVRAQDEAQETFKRVRHSFDDFFHR